MEKTFSPHLTLAKTYWKDHIQPNDIAIDATCGNGHDTLFLSEICTVIGLDIQEKALQNTQKLLQKHQKNATLHLLSHALIDTLSFSYAPRLIVYNLGYLPHADKTLTTKTDSTIESVRKSLQILAKDGAISITCYPGHSEGEKEQSALEIFISELPSDRWKVTHHKWCDRPKAPSLIWISSII